MGFYPCYYVGGKNKMKILAIISSFRKKNTYKTVKQIERIHQSISHCEYEYLFLKDTNLKTCIGCHLCLTKGERYCPIKDDRDAIIVKIESVDAVILASPNHTMNVNWLMKKTGMHLTQGPLHLVWLTLFSWTCFTIAL